jgi:hypothetical protein
MSVHLSALDLMHPLQEIIHDYTQSLKKLHQVHLQNYQDLERQDSHTNFHRTWLTGVHYCNAYNADIPVARSQKEH